MTFEVYECVDKEECVIVTRSHTERARLLCDNRKRKNNLSVQAVKGEGEYIGRLVVRAVRAVEAPHHGRGHCGDRQLITRTEDARSDRFKTRRHYGRGARPVRGSRGSIKP